MFTAMITADKCRQDNYCAFMLIFNLMFIGIHYFCTVALKSLYIHAVVAKNMNNKWYSHKWCYLVRFRGLKYSARNIWKTTFLFKIEYTRFNLFFKSKYQTGYLISTELFDIKRGKWKTFDDF